MSAAFPDEHVKIIRMLFESENIIETDLEATATHLGTFMGVLATGKQVHYSVTARYRFEDDRMAESWAIADSDALIGQLTQR